MKACNVLLMAYGSPESLDDVEAYYTHIRRGKTPTPEKVVELKRKYELIGGTSPLTHITLSQAEKLESRLLKENIQAKVVVGMKHWHPYIEEAVKLLGDSPVNEVISIVLAPHYSRLSVGQYHQYIEEAKKKHAPDLILSHVERWGLEPGYLEALKEGLITSLKGWEVSETLIVFTAHSLPERIRTWDDPYENELLETSKTLATSLNLPHWRFAFQSASATGEPWLGPDLLEALNVVGEERKIFRVLVCPIGFIADHLEVLYDIDIEAQQKSKELGIKLRRTPSLNDHSLLIESLCGLVLMKSGHTF